MNARQITATESENFSHVNEKELTTDDSKLEPEEHYPLVECRSVIETCESASDECTIFPVECEEPLGTTEWITAREGSYIPIEETQ
jgi:hypothetical protein